MSEPTTPSLRDSLEAAIGTEKVEAAPAPETVDYADAPAAEAEPQTASDEAPAAPAQDLNALSEGTPQEVKPQEEAPQITPGPKPGPKGDKAPASWKPELRDHWGKLPEPVRAEVARREAEVQRTLQETAEARRYAESISKAFQPYEAYIRAEGATPMQVIDNLMGTAVRLRTATGPELANLMAGMVKQFGTGRFGQNFIEMLDGALAGATPNVDPQQQQLQQVIQQQLAPVQQFMTQFQQAQQAQQQQLAYRAQSEVTQFIEKAEFGNDVRNEMADLMEVAQRNGRELSLADAYKQACLMNPSVRKVLQTRQQQRGFQNQTQAAQKARSAAVSVSSSGAPMGAPQVQNNDVRSAIEAALAMTSR